MAKKTREQIQKQRRWEDNQISQLMKFGADEDIARSITKSKKFVIEKNAKGEDVKVPFVKKVIEMCKETEHKPLRAFRIIESAQRFQANA